MKSVSDICGGWHGVKLSGNVCRFNLKAGGELTGAVVGYDSHVGGSNPGCWLVNTTGYSTHASPFRGVCRWEIDSVDVLHKTPSREGV